MDGALEQTHRDIALKISDGKSVLYNELVHNDPHFDPKAKFKKQVVINIYGRNWTFNLSSSKSFYLHIYCSLSMCRDIFVF